MVSVGANSLGEIPGGQGHGVQATPVSRLRRPSYFLLEVHTEMERGERAFGVDEYSRGMDEIVNGGSAVRCA
ncbi:hypothetical protein EMIT0P2_90121 [Pseudomonas sp. IT-P2]